jgi:hypothetical protein
MVGSGIRKKPIPDPGSRGKKGTGSRIRIRNTGQYYAQIIRAGKLEAHLFFFLNFKGTPQKDQKIIFSGITICKMALFDQSDFLAIFHLLKMTYRNFINAGIQQSVVTLAPYDGFTPLNFRKLTFRN